MLVPNSLDNQFCNALTYTLRKFSLTETLLYFDSSTCKISLPDGAELEKLQVTWAKGN